MGTVAGIVTGALARFNTIRALILRIGFGAILYYNLNTEPRK